MLAQTADKHKESDRSWSDSLWKVLLRKRTFLIAFPVGTMLILAFISYSLLKSSPHHSSAPLAANATVLDKKEEVRLGLPVRLKIPKISIDAAVDYVGLTPQGDMDTPKGPATAGWYQHGPRPGEKGSSVIDGHFGYRDRIPAVFDNLHTLQKGDKIYIEDETGTTITFVTRELKTYGPNDDAADVFRSGDGKAHLNLITCQGSWNATQQSYSTRLVVFADKET